jgi:alpha,alpha-trehalase
MKYRWILFLAFTAFAGSSAQVPSSAPETASNADATLLYIHAAWDSLVRSMRDCHSLVDVKITADPVLYIPAEMQVPRELATAEQKCHVRVIVLPHPIRALGDMRPEELPAAGLLYLPNPYVVPGGRFNEMYGWDSYFIVLGLEADHREALAKEMVDNFLFEIEHYGAVLNANRSYYLTRSQPPFLTSMIRAVYENPASFPDTAAGRAESRRWLERAYSLAEKDYSTWTRPEHAAGQTGLARYFDYATGPVPEMADDSTYYRDVIRWLLEHPSDDGKDFLIKGSEHPNASEAENLKQSSCDIDSSVVCKQAWFGGYRLSYDFYLGDRAMRESGFDPSFRFGPFSGATHHYAPVCLNSLLYRYELDLAYVASLLGKHQEANHWQQLAKARAAAIQRYLWRPEEGVFADYDFVQSKPSSYAFITSFYPLWSGAATADQARRMDAKLSIFERPGGLSMSNTRSGLQWDEPFGWAPTNWITVSGLDAAGFHKDAERIARAFNATVDAGFASDGTMREKYNVASGNAKVTVDTGYKTNVVGFGWTNGVYLKMKEVMQEKDSPSPDSRIATP